MDGLRAILSMPISILSFGTVPSLELLPVKIWCQHCLRTGPCSLAADVGGRCFPSWAKSGIIHVCNIGFVLCIYRNRTLIGRLFFFKILLHIVSRREMQMILLTRVQISLPMKFYLFIYFF